MFVVLVKPPDFSRILSLLHNTLPVSSSLVVPSHVQVPRSSPPFRTGGGRLQSAPFLSSYKGLGSLSSTPLSCRTVFDSDERKVGD